MKHPIVVNKAAATLAEQAPALYLDAIGRFGPAGAFGRYRNVAYLMVFTHPV
jgi:hypothetical protein